MSRNAAYAYLFGFAGMLVAVIAIIAIVLVMPLKSTDYIPIVVDRATGETVVRSSTSEIEDANLVEVLDRFWITRYVTAREGYNGASLASDFALVDNATSNRILTDYRQNFDESRPDNYMAIYRGKEVRVRVKTISLLSDRSTQAKASSERSYSVSFSRTIVSPGSGEDIINYTVIMTTTFRQVAQEESQIRLNPLGFYVSAYSRSQMLSEAIR